jgi:hypothetical protein
MSAAQTALLAGGGGQSRTLEACRYWCYLPDGSRFTLTVTHHAP